MIFYVVVKWVEFFFFEIYINSITLKVEGPNHEIFGGLLFGWVFNLYTQSLPKFSSGVMHIHELVLWEKPNLIWTCWVKYMGYKLQRSHWRTLGRSWDHLPKEVVPTLKMPTCLEDDFYIYVILAHMIVGNTLNQYMPSIHVDCHLMSRKPHKNIRWRPILNCMSS